MTAVFKDINGAKRDFLWQYDKGQILVIEDLDIDISPEVHFATSSSEEAIVVTGSFQDGVLKAPVPDALLLEARKITIYLYINGAITGETIRSFDIFIRPRKKPCDYIYTDDMYVIDVQSVNDGVTKYLDTHMELVEDVIINYTTVHLVDDTTGIEYIVGINNNKLYIKKVD